MLKQNKNNIVHRLRVVAFIYHNVHTLLLECLNARLTDSLDFCMRFDNLQLSNTNLHIHTYIIVCAYRLLAYVLYIFKTNPRSTFYVYFHYFYYCSVLAGSVKHLINIFSIFKSPTKNVNIFIYFQIQLICCSTVLAFFSFPYPMRFITFNFITNAFYPWKSEALCNIIQTKWKKRTTITFMKAVMF